MTKGDRPEAFMERIGPNRVGPDLRALQDVREYQVDGGATLKPPKILYPLYELCFCSVQKVQRTRACIWFLYKL